MDKSLPILQTKIVMPRRRSDLLTRRRLLDLLSELLDYKLVILSAPAGYGKTSLLIDFAHHTEWPFCWYALDNLDREPQRFLAHFIASIAQQFPTFGQRSLTVLQNISQGDLNLDSMLSVIINDVFENITEHFVIVLDDYHLVDNSKPVSYFVNRFIQDTDENCHVIIASRTLISLADLPLMVAHSQVGGLSFEELAFLPNEIQNLLLQNYHLTLSDSAAKELAHQAEGWITGLLLSTSMIRLGLEDRLGTGKASGVGLYDYLAQQVLERQSPAMRNFLLWTSLLDEFDASFCYEILSVALGIQDNWALLMDTLFRDNLFVLPVGEEKICLRYHHLFRDFLQERILQERPKEAAAILARLSEVYSARGRWEQTYELLHRLGRTEAVIHLIEESGRHLIESGRIITLSEWLEALPSESLRSNPALLSLQGSVVMMRGDPHRGLELLDRAVGLMEKDTHRFILTETLVRRSTIHRTLGEYNPAMADADEALNLCGDDAVLKTIKAEALRMKGLAFYLLGQLKEAQDNLMDSLNAYQQLDEGHSVARLWLDLGLVYVASGNYFAAEDAYSKALEYWRKVNNFTWLANVLNNLGELQRLMGDYEKAIATLEEAIECSKNSGYLRLEAYSLATIGDLYGDLLATDQALVAYNQARQITERLRDKFLSIYLDLLEAVLVDRRGNTLQARKLLKNATASAEAGGSQYTRNLCRLETGRINLHNHEFAEAVFGLETAAAYFIQEGHATYAMQAQLYLAIARQMSHGSAGDDSATQEYFKQIIAQVSEPVHKTTMLVTVREVRPYLEKMKVEPDLGRLIRSLLLDVDRFDQSLSILRRHLRHKATVVPFAPPKMYFRALGKTQVLINDRLVTTAEWQTQTARDLFFYLLVHREGIVKESVGEIFWPDSSPAELKMRFKNTIYRLRRAVGKDVVIYQNNELYLFNTNLDYEYDVEMFYKEIYHAERATDRQQQIKTYQAALKIYQGPFLADEDDTWILVERQKVYNVYINALLKLTTIYLEDKDYDAALTCCQRALNDDPCLEDAHRLAMRAYAALGNRGAIVRQYEFCRQALSEEFNATPSPNTRSLYEMLMK